MKPLQELTPWKRPIFVVVLCRHSQVVKNLAVVNVCGMGGGPRVLFLIIRLFWSVGGHDRAYLDHQTSDECRHYGIAIVYVLY